MRFMRRAARSGGLVPWVALKGQFGAGYVSLRKFRQVFLQALRQVRVVYSAASSERRGRGATTPPPSSPVAGPSCSKVATSISTDGPR